MYIPLECSDARSQAGGLPGVGFSSLRRGGLCLEANHITQNGGRSARLEGAQNLGFEFAAGAPTASVA